MGIKKNLGRYRQALLAKRKEVADKAALAADINVAPKASEDMEQALNSYEHELAISRREGFWSQLRLIDEALRRMEKGIYGSCLECGEEIAPTRLQVVPWARLCLLCQEDEERRAALDKRDESYWLQGELVEMEG